MHRSYLFFSHLIQGQQYYSLISREQQPVLSSGACAFAVFFSERAFLPQCSGGWFKFSNRYKKAQGFFLIFNHAWFSPDFISTIHRISIHTVFFEIIQFVLSFSAGWNHFLHEDFSLVFTLLIQPLRWTHFSYNSSNMVFTPLFLVFREFQFGRI
jgi:hypothetical protein